MITKGEALYVYLNETEKYDGEDTGKYTITVGISDDEAEALEKAGVKVKTTKHPTTGEMMKARKFSTQFKLSDEMIQTTKGEVIGDQFGTGSKVTILWKEGVAHSRHGVGTYLTAIKVQPGYTPPYVSADDDVNAFFG